MVRLDYAFVATALHGLCCVLHRVPHQGTQRLGVGGNSDLYRIIIRFHFLPETNKSLWGDTLRPVSILLLIQFSPGDLAFLGDLICTLGLRSNGFSLARTLSLCHVALSTTFSPIYSFTYL